MPEEIVTVLTRVAASLPDVRWPETEEIRRTARSRRRRHRTVAGVATVLLITAGAAGLHTAGVPGPYTPGQSGPSAGASTCPGGQVPANILLPEYRDIKIRVFNGTLIDDLAAQAGAELRNRGLEVDYVGNAADEFSGIALIRYGPAAVGAAWVMQSFFAREVEMSFELDRTEDTVDITLGRGFERIATPTETNQSIAAVGPPVQPPGTCAGS